MAGADDRRGLAAAIALHQRQGDFLIWSNEHAAWWRPFSERGYTTHLAEAGRWTREDAERIVAQCTVDGQIWADRTDPVSGRAYREYSEVVVRAPDAGGRPE